MYVFIPETLGRSLEELAFCASLSIVLTLGSLNFRLSVFEEEELNEQKRRIESGLEGTDGTGSEKSVKV